MITFEHVTKQYPAGSFSLADCNFTVQDGEFVFLIGPSGAGKTTILRLILRELLPDTGSIVVDNDTISEHNFSHTEDLRKRIGAVYQNFKIIQEKKVIENIAVSLEIMGSSSIREEAMEALSLVGLSDKALFFPLQLSAGELQRLAIARAIAGGRNIILADEPTGNVDPVTSWEIVKLFKKIHTDNRTILFATHSADIVNALKKRVIVFKQGKLMRDTKHGKYNLDMLT